MKESCRAVSNIFVFLNWEPSHTRDIIPLQAVIVINNIIERNSLFACRVNWIVFPDTLKLFFTLHYKPSLRFILHFMNQKRCSLPQL